MANKVYILGRYEDVVCVLSNRRDAEEMFLDLMFEDQFETFNLCVNYEHMSVEVAMARSTMAWGYWIEEAPFCV